MRAMRWLLHGNLSPAAVDALRRHGHDAKTMADVGLVPEATPVEIFEQARKAQLDIMTADPAMAQAPFETPVRFKGTLVQLNVEGGEVEQDEAIDRLFKRYKRLSPGRLYTVTGARVKVRQLPGTQR
jgi:predicted nuclease of predicted toxin-antitoxin system